MTRRKKSKPPELPRRSGSLRPGKPRHTVAQIQAALDELEAAGLIEIDRAAGLEDGRLHIRLPFAARKKS